MGLKERLGWLERRLAAMYQTCVCRTWRIPVIWPDEPAADGERPQPLPERCPGCGRRTPVQAIFVRYEDGAR